MRPWIEEPSVAVPPELSAVVGGHPLVAETLARRGLTEPAAALAFLDPARYRPAPALSLPGMAAACSRLNRAIRARERICVWGDFDVDGQTATAILVAALGDLGADVIYHVPVRARESHGVGVPALREQLDAGARLILTCDTGISAIEAVDFARARGVDVVVTDHHDLPPVLPRAAALLSPKLLPIDHPLRDLPGAGVAWKLAEALHARAGDPAGARPLLDLAALGIVADLALQRRDTRYLLQLGLEAIRDAGRPGLRVLMQVAGVDPASLTEEQIGFMLGPRLNAAGRLDDANPCVELFTTTDLTRAEIIARNLESLNARRKLLCDQVEQGAQEQLDRDRSLLDSSVLVLANPHWPAGVVGIVASRLVERYGKPAILISSPAGEIGRASARSVEGLDITAALASHAALLENFGGHAMAAGFGIRPERIAQFRVALARTIASTLNGADITPALRIESRLSLAALSLDFVADINRLAPFGPGNRPFALLAERLRVAQTRTVGRNDEHRVVTVRDTDGGEFELIWWNSGNAEVPAGAFDLAYTPRVSTRRGDQGGTQLQIEWLDCRPAAGVDSIVVAPEPSLEVIDLRASADPSAVLAGVWSDRSVVVWAEGEPAGVTNGKDRRSLAPARSLAIWTAPPGPAELRAVLARVAPQTLYLFGVEPGVSDLGSFLTHLAGLARYAVKHRGGEAALEALAAATAQKVATVRLGLEWLVEHGDLEIVSEEQGNVTLRATSGPVHAGGLARVEKLLVSALLETAAYRRFFRTAPPSALLPPVAGPSS